MEQNNNKSFEQRSAAVQAAMQQNAPVNPAVKPVAPMPPQPPVGSMPPRSPVGSIPPQPPVGQPFAPRPAAPQPPAAPVQAPPVESGTRHLREEVAVNFKKSFMGFNPPEVMDYITIQNNNAVEAQKVFDSKIEEYKNSVMLIGRERDSFREQVSVVNARLAELEAENARIRDIVPNFEKIEAENESLKRQNSELEEKNKETKALTEKNMELSEGLSDAQARIGVLLSQQKKYEAEIAELRETNKKQLYDFAKQQNEVETRCAADRLKIVKLLQVHAYHIRQSDTLLKEAQKQFDLAQKTFRDMGME